jgi:tetratricopeptide (TPR) repeat protein
VFRQFDELMKVNEFSSALPLADTIITILANVPGYKESYEPGKVYNNIGSTYLSMALYESKDSSEKGRLLELAKRNIDSSVVIYNTWLNKYSTLCRQELFQYIKPFFPENDDAFKGKSYKKVLQKRVDDLILAQKETPRRLSVCYTILGIVLRHQYKLDEAVENYIKAIKLWKDNYTARNNFNVLMGQQHHDRSIIDKLFPPDKNYYN